MNPIISRELISHLRSRKLFLQLFVLLLIGGVIACIGYSQARSTLIMNNTMLMQAEYDGRFIFFFLVYLACLLAVPIATMAASSVVSERESDSLDLLLTTPLKPWSILVGKLLAILLSMVLMLSAFMPILALCFMIGGLSPDEVFQAILALSGLYSLVATIGIAISMLSRSSGTAARISIFALILLLLGPFSVRMLYEVAKIGVVYIENVKFSVEVWFNPVLAIFLLHNPRQQRVPSSDANFYEHWLYELHQTPGFLSGGVTLITALVGFFILSRFFSAYATLLSTRFSWLELLPSAQRLLNRLNPVRLAQGEEGFAYGAGAIIQKEILTKNRRVLSHDITVIISCSFVMFLSAWLLFAVARDGRDVSHSITYMILGVFGLTLSGLYAPILPSFSIWNERLIEAWEVLRTTTLRSKDIIQGKVYAAVRQSALPIITLFISFYISINIFFIIYQRDPERYYIIEIILLLFFFLTCTFFYSCIGIYFSSSPAYQKSAPFRKTYSIIFLHWITPVFSGVFLLGLLNVVVLPLLNDQSLFRDLQNMVFNYIFTLSPAWLIWVPDWGFSTFAIIILHSAAMIIFGNYLLKKAGSRIDYML